MNRKTFLQKLTAWLAVLPVASLFFKRKSGDVRFYWCYEDSEIYAAHDLEELNELMDKELGDFSERTFVSKRGERIIYRNRYPDEQPRLVAENNGDMWGEVSGNTLVTDQETGEQLSFRESVKQWHNRVPCQVSTSYA
jgi:hypothetical protein